MRDLIFLLLRQASLFAARVGIVEKGDKTELEPALELLGREDFGRILWKAAGKFSDLMDHDNLDRALRPTHLSFFAADSGLM